MAKLSTDELLDAFKELTLIELSEFVKQFEDTFGVTAAAPVAVAAAAPAAGGGDGAAPEEEESDEVDVILEAAGDKKIQVIKEVRTPHQPGPEGGQGAGRGRAEGRPGEGHQGGRQQGEGGPRGRRRQRDRQVGPQHQTARHTRAADQEVRRPGVVSATRRDVFRQVAAGAALKAVRRCASRHVAANDIGEVTRT